jgi:hypothetical protein
LSIRRDAFEVGLVALAAQSRYRCLLSNLLEVVVYPVSEAWAAEFFAV